MERCEILAPYLERFTAVQIWDIGLQTLGFPWTWNASLRDLQKIKERLDGI